MPNKQANSGTRIRGQVILFLLPLLPLFRRPFGACPSLEGWSVGRVGGAKGGVDRVVGEVGCRVLCAVVFVNFFVRELDYAAGFV